MGAWFKWSEYDSDCKYLNNPLTITFIGNGAPNTNFSKNEILENRIRLAIKDENNNDISNNHDDILVVTKDFVRIKCIERISKDCKVEIVVENKSDSNKWERYTLPLNIEIGKLRCLDIINEIKSGGFEKSKKFCYKIS